MVTMNKLEYKWKQTTLLNPCPSSVADTCCLCRAEHEIYIGNYPAGYKEEELKNLFSEFLVDVGKIRMKSDGHKV